MNMKCYLYVVNDYHFEQGDANIEVRARMVDAGIMIIDKRGKDNVSLLLPIFENYLDKKVSPRALLLIGYPFSNGCLMLCLFSARQPMKNNTILFEKVLLFSWEHLQSISPW